MRLRICFLAAGAGLLLQQAALGCRHHRPSFNEGMLGHSAVAGRSVDAGHAAAFADQAWRPRARTGSIGRT
jgi:hypothetical protein